MVRWPRRAPDARSEPNPIRDSFQHLYTSTDFNPALSIGTSARACCLAGGRQEPAEALGVTFQRVQKCEKGTKRISAGTLHELSRLLDTPVQFFFDNLGGVAGRRGNKARSIRSPAWRKTNNHETHRREIAGSYRACLLAGDNGMR
jgi:hypothetical protein